MKAASEIFAPVAGEVIEVNGALADQPGAVNADPEGKGWFLKLRVADPAEVEALMTIDAYQEFLRTI